MRTGSSENLKLIDCTYIHGAVRCLRGKAVHSDDVTNFLRLVGEVLVTDGLLFTADPKGPVYSLAIEATEEIERHLGREDFFLHFLTDDIGYRAACEEAASRVARDLNQLPKYPLSTGPSSPVFDSLQKDPDIDVIRELGEAIRLGKALPVVDLSPAHATRFVLSQPTVAEALRSTNLLESLEDEDDYVRLSASVRATIYHQIGSQISAPYLPATSRAKLLPQAAFKGLPLAAGSAGLGKHADVLSLTSVAAAVDGLVKVSRGDPAEILQRAQGLRDSFKYIDGHVRRSAPGDALCGQMRAMKGNESALSTLNEYLHQGGDDTLLSLISISLILFCIPVPYANLEDLRQWWLRRRHSRYVAEYAEVLWEGRDLDEGLSYRNLTVQSGLHGEIAPSVDRLQLRRTVLLVHGPDDKPLSMIIQKALVGRGMSCLLMKEVGHAGERVHQALRRAVNSCFKVLLVVSRSGLDSPLVQFVVVQALMREAREGGASFIIPLAVDDNLYSDVVDSTGRKEIVQELRGRVIADGRSYVGGKGEEEIGTLVAILLRSMEV